MIKYVVSAQGDQFIPCTAGLSQLAQQQRQWQSRTAKLRTPRHGNGTERRALVMKGNASLGGNWAKISTDIHGSSGIRQKDCGGV